MYTYIHGGAMNTEIEKVINQERCQCPCPLSEAASPSESPPTLSWGWHPQMLQCGSFLNPDNRTDFGKEGKCRGCMLVSRFRCREGEPRHPYSV